MKRSRAFKAYIVIGTGTIAQKVLGALKESGINPLFLISRTEVIDSTHTFCERNQIEWRKLDKQGLADFLTAIDRDTLVISAANRYLFPKAVIDNTKLYIINYHGALLPSYPGRNAEAWCIFEGESLGGITWHEVNEGVDTGMILDQRSVELDGQITSIKLLGIYARLAEAAFKDFLPWLIAGKWNVYPQSKEISKKDIYYSWKRPNDKILDTDWDPEKISRFLRAFDYGPLESLGLSKVEFNNTWYEIVKHKISRSVVKADQDLSWAIEGTEIHLKKGGYEFRLKVKALAPDQGFS